MDKILKFYKPYLKRADSLESFKKDVNSLGGTFEDGHLNTSKGYCIIEIGESTEKINLSKVWKAFKDQKECPHCKFFEEMTDMLTVEDIKNRTVHFIMTEIFVYLHDGKAYCNWNNKT